MEAIQRTGPGGNYLTDEHTLRNFRESLWQPQLVNRDNPDTWRSKGSQRHEDRARQRALEILASAGPAPLAAGASMRLAELLAEAEAELAHVQFRA